MFKRSLALPKNEKPTLNFAPPSKESTLPLLPMRAKGKWLKVVNVVDQHLTFKSSRQFWDSLDESEPINKIFSKHQVKDLKKRTEKNTFVKVPTHQHHLRPARWSTCFTSKSHEPRSQLLRWSWSLHNLQKDHHPETPKQDFNLALHQDLTGFPNSWILSTNERIPFHFKFDPFFGWSCYLQPNHNPTRSPQICSPTRSPRR